MIIAFRTVPLLLAISYLLVACEDDSTGTRKIELYVHSAQAFLEQGQFRAGLIEVKNVLQLDPSNEAATIIAAKISLRLGLSKQAYRQLESIKGTSLNYFETLIEAYIQSRKYNTALATLHQHKTTFASHPITQKLLTARAHEGLRHFDDAEILYTEVLALEPDNLDARLGEVRILAARGNLDTVESRLKDILAVEPQHIATLVLTSALYLRQGQLDLAEETLTSTITALPSTDIYTRQRAIVLRALISLLATQGRSGEALIYQRILTKAFPRSQEISGQFQSALTNIKDGQVDQAVILLEEILESSSENEAAGSLLGILKYIDGDFETADSYFAQSVDAEIAPPYVLKYMASNLYKMGQLTRIVRTLEGRIDQSEDPHLLAIYGISALNSNRVERGIKALNRAISLDSSNPHLSMILAQYYNDLDPPNRDRALELLNLALENNIEDVDIQGVYFRQLIQMDKMEMASAFVKSKVAEKPGDPHTILLSGSLDLSVGKLDSALEHFSQVISINPEEENGYFGMAQVFLRQSQWHKARESYLSIIKIAPEDIRGYRGLIDAYDDDNQDDPGLQDLERLADGGNENAKAVVVEYLATNSRLAEAEAYLDVMEAGEPDSAQTRRLIAQVSYRRTLTAVAENDFKGAREAVFKALRVYPSNVRLLTLLAQIEIRTENFGEAEKVILEIREFHPDLSFPNTLSGDLAIARKDYISAIDSYRISWNQSRDDIVALKLFQAFIGSADNTNAKEFTYEWEAEIPGSVLAIVNRAEIETDPDAAIKIYEQWQVKSDPSHVILNNLAWLYLEKGHLQDAMRVAEQAHTLMPENAAVIDTYGWIMSKAGEHERAVEYLRKALNLAPDSKDIKSHLETAQALDSS